MADLIDFPSPCDRERSGTKSASLGDLVERLVHNEKAAWDEFFLRFTGLMINAIGDTLSSHVAHQPDRVRLIWEGLVEHILAKKAFLGRLRSPNALPSVLEKMSENFTITFLRKQSTRKGVISQLEAGSTTSIEAPKAPQRKPKLTELIERKPRPPANKDVDIRAFFSSTVSEEDLLLLKVLCLFYQPLAEEDLEAIAAKRKTSFDAIRAKVDQLMDVLLKREERRLKAQNQAGIEQMLLWRRSVQLGELRKNALLNAELIKTAEMDIEKLSKKVKNNRDQANTVICPKSREIAELIGIPVNNVTNINLRLHRLRKKLASSLENKRRLGEPPY